MSWRRRDRRRAPTSQNPGPMRRSSFGTSPPRAQSLTPQSFRMVSSSAAFAPRLIYLIGCSYRLQREHVGLHLYIIGTEPFIWDVVKLARSFGMDSDEYHATHEGSEKRRVYCVHCRTMTQGVTTNIATCAGCGAHLQVRGSFFKTPRGLHRRAGRRRSSR